MDEWLEWNLKGSFRVQIPAEARTRLDDDQTTAVIQLGSGEDVTEFLLSSFPLKKPAQDKTELADALQDIARDFFNRAVAKGEGHAVPIHVDFTEEPELELYYAEGISVLKKGGDRIWVARFYARPGENRFWIMHWNGPKGQIERVMRIFISFAPDQESFR